MKNYLLLLQFLLTFINAQDRSRPNTPPQKLIDIKIPGPMLEITSSILDGAEFMNALNDLMDSNLLDRELGYSGGAIEGITTRQIPGGPRLYANNAPGVVFIANLTNTIFGSGSIISDEGYIITNWHVVDGSQKMLVWFYDKRITTLKNLGENNTFADVIGVDKKRDLALLKLQSDKYKLKPLKMGNHNQLSVAQDVFAIGHPESQIWTFSYGVISQIHASYEWGEEWGVNHVADLIQTQTPINPGNSGGPLFDDRGRLIGINTFGFTISQGLNFALSINEVESFYKDVLSGKFKPDQQPSKDIDYKDWLTIDSNNNGVPDGYYYSEGDRIILLIDEDEDEIPDVTLINLDNDTSEWDAEVYDRDQDGFFEYWMMDTDNNGKMDNAMLDTDKDGLPDYAL
tara:strand:+ start:355 stop:1554 length:1200 start_codon:yes stop_codon:yes gene_type:complete